MPRKERARIWFGFAGLAVVLAALFIWNLNAGSVSISVREIVSNLFMINPHFSCQSNWLSLCL